MTSDFNSTLTEKLEALEPDIRELVRRTSLAVLNEALIRHLETAEQPGLETKLIGDAIGMLRDAAQLSADIGEEEQTFVGSYVEEPDPANQPTD